MTTLTIVGKVTDALGHAAHRWYGWEGNAAVERRSYEALPSSEYAPIRRRSRSGWATAPTAAETSAVASTSNEPPPTTSSPSPWSTVSTTC